MRRVRLKQLASIVMVMAIPLVAQTVATPEIPSVKLSLNQLQKIVQAMGFECSRDKGDEFFTFQAQGYKVAVFSENGDTDLELYAGFKDVRPTVRLVNDWNQSHRFTRAYVDDDGDAVLVLDLDFTAGVTTKNVEQTVRLFRNAVAAYAQFCLKRSSPS